MTVIRGAFSRVVSPQPMHDQIGQAIRVGQAIVYEGSAGKGMALYEVLRLTEKLIMATRIEYETKSRLHYPHRAIVLMHATPDEIRQMIAARAAEFAELRNRRLK